MKPPLPVLLLLLLPSAIVAAAVPNPTATSDAAPPPAAALAASSPPTPHPDVLQAGCFVTSPNLADYNAYGFRKYKQGAAMGTWTVDKGETDLYSAVAVAQSAAAGGGQVGVWLLPPTVPPSCTTLVDIDGDKPATISQTIPTIPGGEYRLSFSFAGNVLSHVGGGPPPTHHGTPPPFKSLSVWWDAR